MKKYFFISGIVVALVRFGSVKAAECGKNCTYTIENNTVYIHAEGAEAETAMNFRFPDRVTPRNFVIDGPIKLGNNTFTANFRDGNTTSISSTNGTLIFNNVGHHAFGDNATLSGNIIITADAEFGSLAFHGVSLAENAKIYCAVENCAQKMRESCEIWDDSSWPGGYGANCIYAVNNIISNQAKFAQVAKGFENCEQFAENKCIKCKNGYLEKNGRCMIGCGENFRQIENWCNRIRWTPAEAAKVLTDDNNNSVTITFRK